MKVKTILAIVLVGVLAIGALALNLKLSAHQNVESSNRPSTEQGIAAQQSGAESGAKAVAEPVVKTEVESRPGHNTAIPEAHLFLHLFKHMDSLEKRTRQAQREGKSIDFTSWYAQEAALSVAQNRAFKTIAAACLSEVERLDNQANEIILQVRAQYPIGQSERVPAVPAELLVLQTKRDATILKYRDALRAQFGDAEFARFEQFIRDKITPNIKTLTPGRTQELRPLPPQPGERELPAFVDSKTPVTKLPRTATNQ